MIQDLRCLIDQRWRSGLARFPRRLACTSRDSANQIASRSARLFSSFCLLESLACSCCRGRQLPLEQRPESVGLSRSMSSPSSERRTAVTSEENEDPFSFSRPDFDNVDQSKKKVGSEKSVLGVCMHGFSHSPGLCPCGFKAPKPSEESPDDQFPSSVHFFKDST
jgi:hypothetical protein